MILRAKRSDNSISRFLNLSNMPSQELGGKECSAQESINNMSSKVTGVNNTTKLENEIKT
jgi:hypothetical protein